MTKIVDVDERDFGLLPLCDHQLRFALSAADNVFLYGGRGAGKTKVGCFKTLTYVHDEPNIGHPFAIFAPSYKAIKATHIREFLDMFRAWEDAHGWSLLKRYRKTEFAFSLRCGSEIILRSFDDPDAARSLTVSGCWIDEVEQAADPAYTYSTIGACVRDKGLQQMFTTSTAHGDTGMLHLVKHNILTGVPGWHFIRARTQDNQYASEKFLNRLHQTMSEDQYDQEVLCKIKAPRFAVYHEFDESKHVVDLEWMPGQRYSIWVDWGESKPHVLIAMHLDIDGQPVDVVVREFCADDINEDRIKPVIRQMVRDIGYPPEMGAADRAVKRMNAWLRNDPAVNCGNVKTMVSKDEQSRWAGVQTVKWRLAPHDGSPRLFFSRSLVKTPGPRGIILCMKNLKRLVKGGVPQNDHPKDGEYDNGADALRYGIVSRYGLRPRLKE